MFYDTVYVQKPNGDLEMKIQLRKDIDTIYIEDQNGDLQMRLIVPNNK